MEFPTQIYIDGALTNGSGRKEVINPATEEHIATVTTAGFEDVERTLQAAKSAFPGWAATSITDRQMWMRRLRDEVIAHEEFLRECVHNEMGKPWAQTHEDWDRLVASLDFYAEEIARILDYGLIDRAGTHAHRMVYEPAGVAVAYLAWNFPLLNLAFKIGPTMAAGCPIIIRPSEATPISAYAVGSLCEKIVLPKGVV
jgi:succinate-semialdehyde dehydrogenase/glutarate-semialdehyde dehydrogenase